MGYTLMIKVYQQTMVVETHCICPAHFAANSIRLISINIFNQFGTHGIDR